MRVRARGDATKSSPNIASWFIPDGCELFAEFPTDSSRSTWYNGFAIAQTSLEERMARIEGAFGQIDQCLGRVEDEMISLREELRAEIAAIRKELKGEISSLKGEIHSLRGEVMGGIGSVRDEAMGEIRSLRGEVKGLYRMNLSVLIPMWVTIIGSIIGIALTR